MFALVRTATRELLSFEFGEPLDPPIPLEERVEWILDDLDRRRFEFVDLSTNQTAALLTRWLREATETSRRLACIRALGYVRSSSSSLYLEPILKKASEPPEIVRETILAIGRIGRIEAFKKVEPFLQSNLRELRKAAIIALSKSVDRSTIALLDPAAGADAELRALAQIGHRRLNALETKDMRAFTDVVIESDEWDDLLHILEFVRDFVVEILGDHRRSTEVRRRAAVLASAGRLTTAADQFGLIAADRQEPMELRIAATRGAGRVRAHTALSPLGELLNESNMELVDAAIESLGQIGTPDCISPLLAHWSDWSGSRREQIQLALRRAATLDGAGYLEAQLQAGAGWKPTAIYVIDDRMHLERKMTEGLLDDMLNSASVDARREAVLLLAFLGGRSDAAKLQKLQSEDLEESIRALASRALGQMRPQP